jgi:thiol-disulfide isomerase/thioredoxin
MTSDANVLNTQSAGRLPGFEGATGWINSSPLTARDLRGKVVLVNFWTYTCINWLRQAPYVRAWHANYESDGLLVVGVHTPEFGFERDLDNVERAVRQMNLAYPVVLDNDYAIWSAFANHYWPALYFADREGRIRHHHFGEGKYDQSEQVIRRLLAVDDLPEPGSGVEAEGIEIAADWGNVQSGESYLGSARSEHFASPGGPRPSESHVYTAPSSLPLNHWALQGDWMMAKEGTTLNVAPGSVFIRFHARDLHLVMGPTSRCDTTRFRVRIDGEAPGDARGADVDAEGFGAVTHQRLHQLVRQHGPIVDRTFELTFLDADVQLFAFTFG